MFSWFLLVSAVLLNLLSFLLLEEYQNYAHLFIDNFLFFQQQKRFKITFGVSASRQKGKRNQLFWSHVN